ncbi:uncharacterized protein J3R85_007572 [Psidium guajava]|nr:uncharacterized protein J3R85_007572 [Psidium guajava]
MNLEKEPAALATTNAAPPRRDFTSAGRSPMSIGAVTDEIAPRAPQKMVEMIERRPLGTVVSVFAMLLFTSNLTAFNFIKALKRSGQTRSARLERGWDDCFAVVCMTMGGGWSFQIVAGQGERILLFLGFWL